MGQEDFWNLLGSDNGRTVETIFPKKTQWMPGNTPDNPSTRVESRS